MKMNARDYLIDSNREVNLSKIPTGFMGSDEKETKIRAKEKRVENIAEMRERQDALYAENKNSLLIVLQAMDAAGKDGIIKHVFSFMNPQGVQVTPFKQPTTEELDHDYLWRIHQKIPAYGNIGIFNRSHYEDVLITRVHNTIPEELLPESMIGDDLWKRRFEEIVNYETYLTQNNIHVLKFFLHISKEEQKNRLLSRIDNEDKNWKFSVSDISERKYWNEYQHAYEDIFAHTSTESAPWYIIPADDKWFARYIVSEITVETLRRINPRYPTLDNETKSNLDEWRQILENEEQES